MINISEKIIFIEIIFKICLRQVFLTLKFNTKYKILQPFLNLERFHFKFAVNLENSVIFRAVV